MSIIGGAISSAATSGIVEQANSMKQASQSKLTPEKTAAKTAAQQINSIFTTAQNNINSSIGDGNSQVTSTTTDIQTLADHATQLGQDNQNALNLINEAKNLVNTYTEQIKAKQQEMQAKQKEQTEVKQKIEQLGGQVENATPNSSPAANQSGSPISNDAGDISADTPEPAGDVNASEVKSGHTKRTKGSKRKGNTGQPKAPAGNNSENLEQLQAKYKSLGQEIKGIGDSISQIQNNDIAGQNSIIQENTSTYTTNLSSIEADRSSMQTKKAEGESNINSTKSKMQATAEADAKSLNTQATSENGKYGTNMGESQQDQAISVELKSIAQSADKNDPNKQKLQQLSKDFKKLSNDFGDKKGVAKSNKENFDTASANINKLDQALQNAVQGDFAKMNQSIYDAYNSAIQQTDIYAQNKLEEGNNTPGGDVKGLKGVDAGKGGFNVNSLASMGMNNLSGLINFDDSTTTGQVLNTLKDVGFQVLGSFI